MTQSMSMPQSSPAPWWLLLDAMEEQFLVLDAHSLESVYLNTAARTALGTSQLQLSQQGWRDLVHATYPGLSDKLLQAIHDDNQDNVQHALMQYSLVQQTTAQQTTVQQTTVQQTTPRFVETRIAPQRLEQQSWLLVRIRDISERAELDDKLTKSYSLYQFMAQANKALLTAEQDQTLFEQLCQAALRAYTIRMAWIGRIQDDVVKPLCCTGYENGYLEEAGASLKLAASASGPIIEAVQQRDLVYINDIEQDPRYGKWREAALKRGYRAMAVIPIWDGTSLFGVMALYSSRKDTFDAPHVGLLREIGGDISVALANIRNNERRLATETRLRQLSQAVEQSGSAVLISNLDGVIEYGNPKFYEVTGYQPEEIVNHDLFFLKGSSTSDELRRIRDTLLQGGSWTGEVESSRKSGESLWSRQTVSPLRNGEGVITHFVITGEDYTSLYHAQKMVQKLAYYDPLTNLPNRRLFIDRLTQTCQAAKRYEQKLALLYLDLDGFKQVNDTLGHAAGDELLEEVARRLRGAVRGSDTVARLGGDEFVIMVTNLNDSEQAAKIARKILAAVSEPIILRDYLVDVTTSIGITTFPEDGADVDKLMRNADMAMYAAKSLGRNNFQFYTEAMNERFVRKIALENRLRLAIEKEEFELYYQPQIDLCDGRLIGFEALVRWIDPEQGMIPPDEFIPLAEETGLIVELGDLVLRMACRQARVFQSLQNHLKIAVNLSAYQFGRSDILFGSLRRELQDELLDPSYLELELTESTLVENISETATILGEFQRLGISVAIDDFGTGYSSLSYLKSLPINLLKIDRKFISELPHDTNDAAITSAVIAMAHELGIRVLAEGVEEQAQLEFLKKHQCDEAQGYLFSPPLPLGKLDNFIASYLPYARVQAIQPGRSAS